MELTLSFKKAGRSPQSCFEIPKDNKSHTSVERRTTYNLRNPTATGWDSHSAPACHSQDSLALWEAHVRAPLLEIIASPPRFVVGRAVPRDETAGENPAFHAATVSMRPSRNTFTLGVETMGMLKGLEKWATTERPPPSCVRVHHLLWQFCFGNKEAFMFEAHI